MNAKTIMWSCTIPLKLAVLPGLVLDLRCHGKMVDKL